MNELEFIRRQVATERSHMAAVRSACAAALVRSGETGTHIEFLSACAGFLVFIVGRFNAQDQTHCDLLRPRIPASDGRDHAVLEALARTLEASRAAIGELERAWRARGSGAVTDAEFIVALRAYLAFYADVLAGQRHVISHLFEAHYGIADWRAASSVDADAILEERALHARVVDLLPEGIVLGARDSAGLAPSPAGAGAPTAARPAHGN